MNNKKGFTLIEILIVISIIGILASIVLVNLGGFRAKGRDAKRIAEVKGLQNALELYFSVKNSYPATLGELLTAGVGVTKLPKDPTTGLDYLYAAGDPNTGVVAANAQGYVVGATLEGDNAVLKSDEDGTPYGVPCGNPPPATDDRIFCVKF